jgi:N-acetylglutamate synthase-like GNAT family acetyltransferase
MDIIEGILDFLGIFGEFIIEKYLDHFGDINELNDSEDITIIINKSFMTVANEFGYTKENIPKFPAFIESSIIENEIKSGIKIFGYKKNKKIFGCAGYKKYTNEIYEIKRLAVLPEYRHLGIGKKLLQYNENIIKRKCGKIVEIHIENNNVQLKQWCEKNKYKEIEIEEINGLPFKVCKMQKEIK